MSKITFFKEAFDTDIFQKDVYKIYLNEEIAEAEIQPVLENIEKGVIFCYTVFSPRNFALLTKNDFSLISLRNYYALPTKSIKHSDVVLESNYVIKDDSEEIKPTEDEVNKLAIVLAKRSRYFKDEQLDKERSLQVYQQWLQNSLSYKLVEKCIFACYGKEIVGIVTMKIKESIGHIDLLAVADEHQNKKLGKALLVAGLEYLKLKTVTEIKITTDGENIPANALYQKNGFVIERIEFVYHKHVK